MLMRAIVAFNCWSVARCDKSSANLSFSRNSSSTSTLLLPPCDISWSMASIRPRIASLSELEVVALLLPPLPLLLLPLLPLLILSGVRLPSERVLASSDRSETTSPSP